MLKKNPAQYAFINIQLHSTVYTTKVEIFVLQTAKLSSHTKNLSGVLLMKKIVSKIWKVSSSTFLLESCSKKVALNALLCFS